jgi:hypothetical protein
MRTQDLALVLLTFWAGQFFAMGSGTCSVHDTMFSSVSSIYSLDGSSDSIDSASIVQHTLSCCNNPSGRAPA